MKTVEAALAMPVALRRQVSWSREGASGWAPLLDREWLVTNGLGGYASGTLSGAATRRYHGLLVAAHPPPLGRVLTLVDLGELLDLGQGVRVCLGGEERPDELQLHGARYLEEFRLEWGLPVWSYAVHGRRIEKRLVLLHAHNTVLVSYRLLEGEGFSLELRPMIRFRPHEAPVNHPLGEPYHVERDACGLRVRAGELYPELRLCCTGEGGFTLDERVLPEFLYRVEASRGYASVGDTWSAGCWRASVSPGSEVFVVGSTEGSAHLVSAPEAREAVEREHERRRGLVTVAHPYLRDGAGAELVLAADQFLIRPQRSERRGAELDRSIIAGYHWFTDWGRDTMIALEGVALLTGRTAAARSILRMFGGHVRDGLIPNLFPEGDGEGLYHTADASLWFFHALDRYLAYTGDRTLLRELLPRLRDVVDAHLSGTRFGIGMDPADGLLRQGAPGYQLTWMDAKVGEWVVTPRRGKAVEINALWYNALRLAARWEREEGDGGRGAALDDRADAVRRSFNARFWREDERCLFDVVDGEDGEGGEAGDDPSFRPNQIFAISLPHAVLDRGRWASVVQAVRERLLTPVGLRSLDPADPDYRSTYFGDLRARDAAYHQGTVWGWLIGPFVDAWLRVHPQDRATARGFLEGLLHHLDEFGVGSVAEIFDGDPPHRPRGCIAQAWSVAELIRCLVLTEEGAET